MTAIVAKVECSVLLTMRVPEAQIPMLQTCGWVVMIRDSDMSDAGKAWTWLDLQSGPRRHGDPDTEDRT